MEGEVHEAHAATAIRRLRHVSASGEGKAGKMAFGNVTARLGAGSGAREEIRFGFAVAVTNISCARALASGPSPAHLPIVVLSPVGPAPAFSPHGRPGESGKELSLIHI